MDQSAITMAIQSIAAIKTIAAGLVSLRDESKLSEMKSALVTQVLELQSAGLAMQAQHYEMVQTHAEAQQTIRDLKERLARREAYELVELTPGAFALAAKPATGVAHAPPYYCQACSAAGQEVALRFSPAGQMHGAMYRCPVGQQPHAIHILGNSAQGSARLW